MLRQGILENRYQTWSWHGTRYLLSHSYFHLDPVVWCDRRGAITYVGRGVCGGRDLPGGDIIG